MAIKMLQKIRTIHWGCVVHSGSTFCPQIIFHFYPNNYAVKVLIMYYMLTQDMFSLPLNDWTWWLLYLTKLYKPGFRWLVSQLWTETRQKIFKKMCIRDRCSGSRPGGPGGFIMYRLFNKTKNITET